METNRPKTKFLEKNLPRIKFKENIFRDLRIKFKDKSP